MQVKEDTIISRFQNGDRRIILWFSLFLQNVTELLDTLLLQKLYFLTPHTHVENPSSATDFGYYQMSQRNWVIIKEYYRCLRRYMLS